MDNIVPNLSKIYVNQIFNNLEELFNATEINDTECTRYLKEKSLKAYIKYEKIKGTNKIQIKEIFAEPKIKIDGRSFGNNSKYNKYAVELLLKKIINTSYQEEFKGKTQIFIPKKDVMIAIGLCNKKYKEYKNTQRLINEGLVTRLDSSYLYQRISNKSKEIVGPANNQIKKRYGIQSRIGNLIVLGDKSIRISTEEEDSLIKEEKNLILAKMKVSNIFMLHLKNKHKDFYELLSINLLNKYSWETSEEVYVFSYADFAFDEINILDETEEDVLRRKTNDDIMIFIDKNAENLYKQRKKYSFTKDDNLDKYNDDLTETEAYDSISKNIIWYPTDYVEKQHFLSKELIKI